MIDDAYNDSFVDELNEIFKPKHVIPSPGIGDMYILRFEKSYLKIYPDENNEDNYIIEQYSGYSQKVEPPMKVTTVKSNRLRQFAKEINIT